ncbi:MAG TPA: YrdB family protein [Balneolales bacterium]|nr:YrdB family protein [Balneolales bacterium]
MSKLSWFNLSLRGIMEAGIVLGLGFWGYQTGESTITRLIFSVLIPVMGFGFWGLIDFHQFGRYAEALRLVQELIISGLAAAALYTSGAHFSGLILGGISIIHHALVYPIGERLLKARKQ